MSLKKMGVALGVMLALGAVMASSAFATATKEAGQWYTGAKGETTLASAKTVTAEAATPFVLTTNVAGTTLELESTSISCQSCTIANTGSPAAATGTGTIKFSNVTVKSPAVCAVSGGSVTTEPLFVEANYMEGTKALQKFLPGSESEGVFAIVTLTKGSGSCPIAGSYIVEGSVFSEAVNKTGVFATSQQNKFSAAINSAAGGELFFGEEPATLTGTGTFKAGGTAFGVK